MRLAPLSLFVVVGLSSLPAFAGFNGSIEMNIANDKAGNGKLKLTIGDAGVISELAMALPSGPMSVKTLMPKAKADVVYLINDAAKTYNEVAVPAAPAPEGDETWTVKQIGKEKIAGYDTVHVNATSNKGNNFELWTAKDIMDAAEFAHAQGPGNKIPGQLVTALKGAGADGFFAKMVAKGKDGSTTTMEVTKVTKGALPASTFEVPAGYAKSNAPGAGIGLPPDVQKKIDEKMKSMTPEQQEALKKSLAGH